ncbi:MAG: hypothetical protein LBJ36_08985 [Synergistaceae bacterium]|jgi:hypothetical protein|nr:hypothetical protein [Synergistaceae bacterium]
MMSYNQALKTLTIRSSLTVLLRTLFCMKLDYCVLLPWEDFRNIIVFSKDQLVSLIERGSSEASISDILKRVAQGLFKPVAIFKSDSSSSDFVSQKGFGDPEQLQVLLIDKEGATVSSLKEALTPKGPNLPEWWEAPIPFVMCGGGALHINRTAMLMFGSDLKRLATSDLPDKNEFLVTLEGKASPCSVMFRRLEGDIFMLDDCTGDVAAAVDITWWAAVGKAWIATLDRAKLVYRRCTETEVENLQTEKENTVLPCEWEGELLGYLCIEKKPLKKTFKQKKKEEEGKEGERVATGEKKQIRHKSVSSVSSVSSESAPLMSLGPQAMGLLAPGLGFDPEKKKKEEKGQGGPR